MASVSLFENGTHRNILLEEQVRGQMARANHHLVLHGGQGLILDPGGPKVHTKILAETTALLGGDRLSHVFLSHQDPDIVAGLNGWLMTTNAIAYTSDLWVRFIPHFGMDGLLADRLVGIPDEGAILDLGGTPLFVLPAHFLHSEGNLQLYDPVAKILYSGDLGASFGAGYREVPDFESHVPFMETFHRRYMGGRAVMRAWASMVRSLDIEIIAPQHGAFFRGRALVEKFISWCEGLECGMDMILGVFKVPKA